MPNAHACLAGMVSPTALERGSSLESTVATRSRKDWLPEIISDTLIDNEYALKMSRNVSRARGEEIFLIAEVCTSRNLCIRLLRAAWIAARDAPVEAGLVRTRTRADAPEEEEG